MGQKENLLTSPGYNLRIYYVVPIYIIKHIYRQISDDIILYIINKIKEIEK